MKLQAEINNEKHEIEITREGEKVFAYLDGRKYELEALQLDPDTYLLKHANKIYEAYVSPQAKPGEPLQVVIAGNEFSVRLIDRKHLRGGDAETDHDHASADIKAIMPGKVVRILSQANSEVKKGDAVLVVEAMKMQNEMKSPKDGIVKEILFKEGSTVAAGDVLAIIE